MNEVNARRARLQLGLVTVSGVLLKMEVGIRKRASQRA